MSDLLQVDRKVQEGADWRGTVDVSFGEKETVTEGGEEKEVSVTYELTHRQLTEQEFGEAVDRVGADNFEEKITSLEENTGDLNHDELEEIRKLSQQDPESLSEEERDRVESMMKTSDVGGLFTMMDPDMINGLHYAAKKGVVPDEEDVKKALNMSPPEMQEAFGEMVKDEDEMWDKLNDRVEKMVDNSVGFTAYSIGLEVLFSSMDDEGN